MLAAAPHRGDQTALATLGRCVLGVTHRNGQADAAVSADGKLAVAFSGTLDNPDELRRTIGDTNGGATTPADIILGAWRRFGDAAPDRLRGVYSCVVSDGSRVWAFRDHIGLETLFYRHEDDGALYVASEAKQVLRGPDVSREPDVEAIEASFYGDSVDPARCALRGVQRLVAGTLLSVNGGPPALERYWDPESLLETSDLSGEDAAERFRELLSQAVARTVTGSDAVSLSGGVDSPPIATYATREYERRWGKPIPALSAVYPTFPESDESEYIQLVAEQLRMPLNTYEPGPQRLDRLQFWVELFDGPWSIWSPEGTAERCTHARRLGVRTLLSGEFAEQVSAVRANLVSHYLWSGRFRAAAAQLRSQRRVGHGRRALAHQVAAAFTPARLQARLERSNWEPWMPPWLDVERIARRNARRGLSPRQRWRRLQVPFFGGDTTSEASIYSHALYGVRSRRPWADVDLWKFFLGLRAEVRFPDYRMKGFARDALRGHVPDAILDRRDKTHINRWFETMALDYPALRRWLVEPDHRVPGVDYAALRERLDREDLPLPHYLWAKDLAAVHAFLDLWR